MKDEIAKTRKEVAELQEKIDMRAKLFQQLGVDYHYRENVDPTLQKSYDEMIYDERKLEIVQQRLSSLLLESTTEALDRLDSSVKTLDSSVGSLSNLTRKLVKSSKTLEYLTSVIIIVAIVPVSLSLLSWNPYYSLLTVIAAFIGLVVVWRRARKELPKI